MTIPSWIAGKAAKLGPAKTTDVSVERDLITKMPDGAALLADRWYPTAQGVTSAGCTRSAATRSSCRAAGGRSGRGRVRPGAQRAGRRARHARNGSRRSPGSTAARHVGRELPRHDAVGRGRGRTRLREGAQPPGHRGELPRRGRVPGNSFALETGLAWIHEIKHQELGWRIRPCAPPARGPGGGDASDVLPSGNATPPPSASPWPSTRTGSSTAPRVTRGGTAVDFGRRLREGAAGQLHRRLVRPLPQGAGGRLRGPPAAGRTAR
jgi:hypothetical protein